MTVTGWRWLGAAVFLLTLLLAGPSGADDAAALKAMPKSQQEVIEEIVKFNDRYEEAKKLTNRLAKKEAMDGIKTEQATWLADLNKKLAAEGVEGWIGQATVGGSELVLENLGAKFIRRVSVHVSVRGLPNEAREAVKTLDKREWVKFTIAPKALRLVGVPGGNAVWIGLKSDRAVDGKMLTKISKNSLE
jgi:hypothetical protein